MPATGENKKRIAREWARRNKQKQRAYQNTIMPSGLTRAQEYTRKNLARALFLNARTRARVKGKVFKLSLNDIEILAQPMTCAIPSCSQQLKVGEKKQGKNSPTLDEIRRGKGYVLGNIAVICHDCNRRKGDMTANDLRSIADWIDSFPEINE